MTTRVQILYSATPAHAAILTCNLIACGIAGARVTITSNGSLRLNLASKDQRDSARDALVLSNAVDACGVIGL